MTSYENLDLYQILKMKFEKSNSWNKDKIADPKSTSLAEALVSSYMMKNSTKFSGRILRKFSWGILRRFYKILHERLGGILQNQICQMISVSKS